MEFNTTEEIIQDIAAGKTRGKKTTIKREEKDVHMSVLPSLWVSSAVRCRSAYSPKQ